MPEQGIAVSFSLLLEETPLIGGAFLVQVLSILGQLLSTDCSRSYALMPPQHLSYDWTIRASYFLTSTGAPSYPIFHHSASSPTDPLIDSTDAPG